MWKALTAINVQRRLWGVDSISMGATYCSLVKATDSSLLTAANPLKNAAPASRSQLDEESEVSHGFEIGKTVSKRDKINFIVETILNLKDDREAVYGALDAWVAWEDRFPLIELRKALNTLEADQQWHKIVQVIKWILSKGQGNTNGIYWQLLKALDRDHRAEEAHEIWKKKVGRDLHSVSWFLCHQIMAIYYRNNMPERILQLFKDLEDFNRKPPDKSVIQRVADACEIMNMGHEKDRILKKYSALLNESEERKRKGKGTRRGEKGTPKPLNPR